MFRSTDSAYADRCLRAGQRAYDLADPSWHGKLLTVSPHGYYPESSGHDDLELGATELALALLDAGAVADPSVRLGSAEDYLAEAAREAKAYLRSEAYDTLNLYDVSGLGHVELHRAIDLVGDPGGLAVTQAKLRKDLRRQLDAGVRRAGRDPFGVGFPYGYDVASHLFGFVATAESYATSPATTPTPTSRRARSARSSARTLGARRSSSAPAPRSRSACSTRWPTSTAPATARPRCCPVAS